MPKIMIIRHAEKHTNGGREHGVNLEGDHVKHELTVRGWLRAGALVPLFTRAGEPAHPAAVATPRAIFASAATPDSPSLRALHTVLPLAAALDLPVNNNHAEGEEAATARSVLAAPGPVLIAWHHSHIVGLAKAIAGPKLACPSGWPEDRFDLVWVLHRDDAAGEAAPWSFAQVAQNLFAYDRPDPI